LFNGFKKITLEKYNSCHHSLPIMGWNRKTILGILIFFFVVIVAGALILLTGNFSRESFMQPWYQATETLGGVCGYISGEDRDRCYQYIARFSGNALLCGKIGGAGPRSRCRIYIAEWWKKGSWCDPLSRQQAGNGSYTYYDCIQYLAVKFKDPGLCDALGKDISTAGNDLNEKGVSLITCIDSAGTSCGHIGQNTCTSIEPRSAPGGNLTREINYCLEGRNSGGRCVGTG
jgi:hypothetical protein